MVFSDSTNNTGIVQQTRTFAGVDATQWSNAKITNSVNNWLDKITGFAISADQRFQFDDTGHSKLPRGTTALVENQILYSFLTDEQGNRILTLTGISLVDTQNSNYETPLIAVDRNGDNFDRTSFGLNSGLPTYYDKISDNVIELDSKPTASDASRYTLKFYFQRTPSYFVSTDTTKEPGVANTLHRGFVISAAYDCAIALGLPNISALGAELMREEQKMVQYFGSRNRDERNSMKVFSERKEQWL